MVIDAGRVTFGAAKSEPREPARREENARAGKIFEDAAAARGNALVTFRGI